MQFVTPSSRQPWGNVNELPTILAIDDKEAIQGFVEDALREGDFDTAAAPTGEEAVTLLKGRLINYRALVSGGAIWQCLNAGRKRRRHYS
jgi:hypothetical protein